MGMAGYFENSKNILSKQAKAVIPSLATDNIFTRAEKIENELKIDKNYVIILKRST